MPEISVATKCVLCGASFYGPAMTLGGDPNAKLDPRSLPPRFTKFMSELFTHIGRAHPERWAFSRQRGDELHGWFVTSLYESKDENVLRQRDYFRWSLLQMTAPKLGENFIEDLARLAAAEFLEAKRALIVTHVRKMLDGKTDEIDFNEVIDEMKGDLATTIEDRLEELFDKLVEPDKFTPLTAETAPRGSPAIVTG